MYKSDISLEFYITYLPMKLRTVFSRFRCRNHKLPVETGIYKNIPRSERVCVKCTQSEIGDEFHYIVVKVCWMPTFWDLTGQCTNVSF